MIAHVGGVPLEEAVPALAGTGTALIVARGWLAHRLRQINLSGTHRRETHGPAENRDAG